MEKNYIITLLVVFVGYYNNVNSQSLIWAKQMGGTSEDAGNSIAVDAIGNVYTAGYFKGTADLDPGAGTFTMASSGLEDIFISKIDASGNFLWAKQIGSTGADVCNSIAVDGSGNVYATGVFSGTVDFNPGAGTNNLTALCGNTNAFVSKLDSSGNYVWATTINDLGNGVYYSFAITVDASSSIYVTGTFTTCIVPNTYIFVSKLNNSGGFLWTKQMGGTNTGEYGYGIAVDGSGNVLTTGNFSGTVDFDPGSGFYPLTSSGTSDIFISKLNSSGAFVWAKQFIGTGNSETGRAICVDASGNVYTTGDYFSSTVDFDPGAGTYYFGSSRIFISKLDASGNFVWAKQIGGTSNNFGYSITLDANGKIYTCGSFQGHGDFEPGTGSYELYSNGSSSDIFLSVIDTSGNFISASSMGGTFNDYGYSVKVDNAGAIYLTGTFQGTADFDPGLGTYNVASAGNYDIFVEKTNYYCIGPAGFMVSNIQPNSMVITWNCSCSSANYYIEYGPYGFIPGTGATPGVGATLITNATSPYVIAGLQPDSWYNIFMRSSCGTTFSPNTSGLVERTAQDCSLLPSITCSDNRSYTVQLDYFTGGGAWMSSLCNSNNTGAREGLWKFTPMQTATYSLLVYGMSATISSINYPASFYIKPDSLTCNEMNWICCGATNTSASAFTPVTISLGTLTSGVTYIIRADGVLQQSSTPLSYTYNFRIDCPNVCSYPVLGNASQISTTSENVFAGCSTCFGNNIALEYGPTGFTPGINSNPGVGGTVINGISSFPVTLSGLTSGNTYEVYARKDCGAPNGFSANSNMISFNLCNISPSSISVSPSSSICPGDNVTLTQVGGALATGGVYNWYTGSCGGTLAGTGSSVVVSPAVTTTYYVRAEALCGNSVCRTVTITVNNLPGTITAAGSTNICTGGSVTLYAGTGSGISYQWRLNGGNISGAIASSYLAVLSGNYDCLLSNSCGNLNSNIIAVAVSGVCSTGLQFNGSPTQVTISDNASYNIGTGDFTIEAWIKASSSQATTNPMLISKRASFSSGFDLFFSAGKLCLGLAGNTVAPGGNDLRDNTCHHVAVSRSGGDINYFVDGALVSTQTGGWNAYDISVSHDLWIGHDQPASSLYFNGIIHEVRFWNLARSPSQIMAARDTFLFGSETGLIGYWKMNEGTGQTIQDFSPTNNSGVLGTTSSVESSDPGWSYGCITLSCASPTATITASGATTFCSPGSVTLNANTGTGLSYQWQNNSVNISGATNSTYLAFTSGNYKCIVTNACGSTPSNIITVISNPVPPAQISSAGPTTVCSPASVTLNANTGVGLTYQWRLNTTPLIGATQSSYTATSSGNYDCIVTNSCGSTTSNAIAVTMNLFPPASITATGPIIFCDPGTVTLNANTGSGLTYQWRQNNVNIPGEILSSYIATASGNFDCVVTNSCGSTTSNAIAISAELLPSAAVTAGGPTTFCAPGSVTLSVSTCSNCTYQWRMNAGNIAGANSSSYTATSAGDYDCVVTNSCGSRTSNNIIVTTASVLPTASISTSGATVFCSPGSVVLNANTGIGLSYQWRLNGGNISGATSSSYSATATGNYSCIVSNSCGSATSNVISIVAENLASSVITASGPTTFCNPGSVTLYAVQNGLYAYQWWLSNIPIAGATSSFYVATAGGNYQCMIYNTCGLQPSDIVAVSILSSPNAIITASGATTFCSPGSVLFNANTGTGLSYQWRLNGGNISGATSSFYSATATGNFDCVVTNMCGSVTSNSISVTVNTAPAAFITASGPTTFCTTGSVTMNANIGSGLTYQWKLNGANIPGATSSSYTANAAGVYNCVVTNSCGSTTSNPVSVTVNILPAAPGSITGQTTGVCASTKTYSIGAVSGATGYTWSVPSGANISSGQGTTSVNVAYTNAYTTGTISVVASSSCGSSGASNTTTTGVPAQPGTITGPASVCHNQNNVNYSIAAVTGATSYTWTVPTGANIVNGQGNITIKVKFGNNAGNITVKANNACGSGLVRTLAIVMPCREGEEISENDFNVNVFPNPSNNDFTFMIDGAGTNFCSINIFDLTGRVVEAHQSVSPNREFKCGNALTDGMYYAEIIWGSQKKVLKLVKQR